MKLQKFIAHAGIASRRKAEEMITEGRVQVNNQPAHIGQVIDPTQDTVAVDGKPVAEPEALRYFLIDKPIGIISTTSDELGRETVLKLLPKIRERLYPVGRLDQDSSGLMLLTNDGALANTLTHPRYEVAKTYQVIVAGIPSDAAIAQLERGVKLKEGYTQPAVIEVVDGNTGTTTLEITIKEGKNHQVRRMMERVGYEVVELERITLGPFTLDQLDGKPYLELTAEEVTDLMAQLSEY